MSVILGEVGEVSIGSNIVVIGMYLGVGVKRRTGGVMTHSLERQSRYDSSDRWIGAEEGVEKNIHLTWNVTR